MHGVKRDGLKVGAVCARGLQPGQGKLGGNVLRGQFPSALAGSTAFKQIKREEPHMGANLFRIDRGRGGAGRRRQPCNLWNRIGSGLLGRKCEHRNYPDEK